MVINVNVSPSSLRAEKCSVHMPSSVASAQTPSPLQLVYRFTFSTQSTQYPVAHIIMINGPSFLGLWAWAQQKVEATLAHCMVLGAILTEPCSLECRTFFRQSLLPGYSSPGLNSRKTYSFPVTIR